MEREKYSERISGKSIVTGWITSVIVLMVFTVIVAMLIESNTINESGARYATTLIVLASSAAGSMAAVGKSTNGKAKLSIIFAASYWLTLVAVTALFFDGRYSGMVVTLLLILTGSILPAILRKGNRKRGYAIRKR